MSNIDISTSRNYLYTLLAGFVLLFAVSCEDKNDDDEGHTDADGFVLETEDGVEAYKEFQGTKTGSIELGVGDTLHFMVHFLDKDGKEIEHEEDGHDDHGDEEDGVRVSGFNAAVAKIAMVEHEEEGHDDHGHDDHDDEHGDKVLEVVGVSSGSTGFKLELMHGDHADYTSTNNVPVVVK